MKLVVIVHLMHKDRHCAGKKAGPIAALSVLLAQDYMEIIKFLL